MCKQPTSEHERFFLRVRVQLIAHFFNRRSFQDCRVFNNCWRASSLSPLRQLSSPAPRLRDFRARQHIRPTPEKSVSIKTTAPFAITLLWLVLVNNLLVHSTIPRRWDGRLRVFALAFNAARRISSLICPANVIAQCLDSLRKSEYPLHPARFFRRRRTQAAQHTPFPCGEVASPRTKCAGVSRKHGTRVSPATLSERSESTKENQWNSAAGCFLSAFSKMRLPACCLAFAQHRE